MTRATPQLGRFLEELYRALETAAPGFDLRSVMQRGARRGVLSEREASLAATRLQFPDWLIGEMKARFGASPDDDQTRGAAEEVLPPAALTCPPVKAAPPGHVPGRFRDTDSNSESPRVTRHDGAGARFLFRKSARLAWTQHGVLPDLSNATGRLLHPFVARAKPVHLPGHTLVAYEPGSAIYTHWLLDAFPKLLLLAEAHPGGVTAMFDRVYVMTAGRPFHQECLASLGVEPDQLVTQRGQGPLISCERFTVLSDLRAAATAHPHLYDLVADHFLYGPRRKACDGTGRRLYVSRADVGRRRVRNEASVIEMLARHGFETVRFADLSVHEAARLVAEADVVVAPHGAGLANLVFATPGCSVLEIYSAHVSNEYWKICAQRGLRHVLFQAGGPDGALLELAQLRQMSPQARNACDIVIDVPRLEAVLYAHVLG